MSRPDASAALLTSRISMIPKLVSAADKRSPKKQPPPAKAQLNLRRRTPNTGPFASPLSPTYLSQSPTPANHPLPPLPINRQLFSPDGPLSPFPEGTPTNQATVSVRILYKTPDAPLQRHSRVGASISRARTPELPNLHQTLGDPSATCRTSLSQQILGASSDIAAQDVPEIDPLVPPAIESETNALSKKMFASKDTRIDMPSALQIHTTTPEPRADRVSRQTAQKIIFCAVIIGLGLGSLFYFEVL
jgi:hypothetical protein